MCAGVPRIFTSGPLDSKLRANGLWFLRLLLRPRPRRFCCPCLTAQVAPMLLQPVSSMPTPLARAWFSLPRGSARPHAPELTAHGPNVMTRRSSAPQLARRPRLSAEATGRQCFSWAISGADDGSPCCEQFYLLRIRSSIPLAADKSAAARERVDDSTSNTLSRTAKESKAFLGLCPSPCSCRHT